jgi:phage/plasmid-like protein (TIGR03299 family)
MPHEVESMAYPAGATPWHGIGTPITDEQALYDWEKVCIAAGLNWEVELVPLVTADTQAKTDSRAVRRKSDSRVLGVVGPRYFPLQNSDALKFFAPFLAAKEAALTTAGSLRMGSRIWALAKLNRDPIVVAAGDEVEKYILLSHSHDGSLAVRVGFTPIRVVCANTLAMAHRADASKLIRLKHTKDLLENLANIREVMDAADAEFTASSEQYKALVRKSINQADLEKYVRLVFKVEDDKDASTRMKNLMQEVTGLFEAGRGNALPSVKHTLWTAYNSVTEHLSYFRGRNADNRLSSLWFGDGANINRHALETALAMAA